jgi:hypothetical protein
MLKPSQHQTLKVAATTKFLVTCGAIRDPFKIPCTDSNKPIVERHTSDAKPCSRQHLQMHIPLPGDIADVQ